jgi:cell division protein FtsQ
LEPVKAMQRGPSAAAEADSCRPELLVDEEPRYLRRQRPLEIRHKKFGARGWLFYRRVFVWIIVGAAGVTSAVAAGNFLLYSPQMLILKADQIELVGNRIVTREAVVQQFARDRNRSVLQVPLDERRSQLEALPWVESASVQRVLPNRLRVELTERTPIAFLQNGTELALIDVHGVILDRPEGEDLHFPIVTGMSENMPREERERRMQTYQEFLKDIDLVGFSSSRGVKQARIAVHPSEKVSEVDLSNPKDLRVVMTGLMGINEAQAVTIHFGQTDFPGKFTMLVDNFAQWHAKAGCVRSVDLQFSRQIVLNSDADSCGVRAAAKTN